jgi:hypothetical protein
VQHLRLDLGLFLRKSPENCNQGADDLRALIFCGAIFRPVRYRSMPYVQSKAFEMVAYDEARHTLRATFRQDGRTEVYERVPLELYDGLIFAESMGEFFDTNIRDNFPRNDED